MNKYLSELYKMFPISQIDDKTQKHLFGYKYFITNNKDDLFVRGNEDVKNNLETVLNSLIDRISENSELKQHLSIESGIDSSKDEFIFSFHHSLSFIIHKIYGINITNYGLFPFIGHSAHQFYKKIEKQPDRKEYFKKLKQLINWAITKKNTPAKSNITLPSKYKLHSKYHYDYDVEYKNNFLKFCDECQKFIQLPSSNITNLESFFDEGSDYDRLEFNIALACVRSFFVNLHSAMDAPGSLIKCPLRIPIEFLCKNTTLVYFDKNAQIYTPLSEKKFGRAKVDDCGILNTNLIKSSIASLK